MQEIKARFGAQLREIESILHQNPEVAFQEKETTRLIRETLCLIGFEPIELGLETGVVARLRTGRNGKVIGLRADIDGIEQQEAVQRPDQSRNKGVMHACGHDTHTAGLLGAAMALAQMKEKLRGDVVVIFQPAEETTSGAKYLVSHHLFSKVPMDALFGLHNIPQLPVGEVGIKLGVLMAAKDDFTIIVRGKGGHGGLPHLCIDPMVAACAIVSAIQTIVSRNVNPKETAVVSVCSMHGGMASNLIPDQVRMSGSARTFDAGIQAQVLQRIAQIANNTAEAYGCSAEVDHYATVPPLINGETLYSVAKAAAERTVTPAYIKEAEVSFASEDFAIYGAHVPCFFYFLGSGTPGKQNASWHSAHFQADPDTVFWGAALLKNSVLAAQMMDHYTDPQ